MKIKKGDKIKVLTGKDKNKISKVLKVLADRVLVENINMVNKHIKSRKANEKSERITLPAPIHISNVQLVCGKCSKPVRFSIKKVESKRVRICKKCQAEI